MATRPNTVESNNVVASVATLRASSGDNMEKRREPAKGNAGGSRSTTVTTVENNQERVQTGIAGLDDILNGGLPQGHLFLVEGDPGTGKTTLALQFLLEGVRRGESVIYVTLSE